MKPLNALTRISALLATIILGFFLSTAHAGNDTWTVVGAPNGGSVTKVLINPTTPSTLYACAGAGFFKSTDSGATWSLSLLLLNQADDAAVDPQNPSTVYVAADDLYKTTDGGSTWTTVENGFATLPGGGPDLISGVSVDPVTEGTAYAASYNSGLYKTTDGGQSWTAINTGLTSLITSDTEFGDVVVDPVNTQNLYVTVSFLGSSNAAQGIYKSTDGGSHWTASITNVYARQVVVDPNDNTHLYSVIASQIYESTNSGGTWTALTSAPTSVQFLRINPNDSKNLILSDLGNTIYYSVDGGATWTKGASNTSFYINDIAVDPVTPSNLYVSTSVLGLYKSTDGGQTVVESDSGLHAVGSLDQMVMGSDGAMYVGSSSGMFKSTDNGANWSAINSGLGTTGGIASIYTLSEDPQTPTTLYAGSPSGLFKTIDGGANWTLLNNGKTDPYTYSLAIDPENSKNVYAGTASGGVFKSTDAGASWQSASTGLPADLIRSLAVDPTNGNIVYAGTEANGLYRSTDGGANWSADNSGLPKLAVNTITIDRSNSQNVYLTLTNGGVYKSTDGGATWTAANNGISQIYIFQNLIMDPSNAATMYAIPISIFTDVYATTDAGADWEAITPLGLTTTPIPVMITTAALDPNHPQTLYGAASDGQIYTFSSVTPTTTAGSLSTNENTAASGQLSGDLQGFGGTLNFAIATPPAHGIVTITDATSGTFTYTPTSGFTGSDSFTFTVSAAGAVSAPTKESISVNSAPKQSSSSGGGGGGALSLWALLLLAGLSGRRNIRRADSAAK